MLSIERQFVRTERPLYTHLVSLLENCRPALNPRSPHDAPVRTKPRTANHGRRTP